MVASLEVADTRRTRRRGLLGRDGIEGALLLTPAYPQGESTLAPALIVAGFEFMTSGYPGARGALRPLAMTSGLAVLLSMLLGFTVFRRKSPHRVEATSGEATPEDAPAAAARGTV